VLDAGRQRFEEIPGAIDVRGPHLLAIKELARCVNDDDASSHRFSKRLRIPQIASANFDSSLIGPLHTIAPE
jgi:hypothetical protein